jgi:histidinol-phosphate aminotransferase
MPSLLAREGTRGPTGIYLQTQMLMPQPLPSVAAIPASTPFVGPEALEREAGQPFDLRLGANESLFGPSRHAIAAMAAKTASTQFYGDPEGYELRSAIAERHGTSIGNVVLASGIDELLMLFARAFVGVEDAVATTLGSYPTFEYAVRSVGGRFFYAHYRNGHLNLEALEGIAKNTHTRIVYLANPDNPSGTFQTSEAIADFRKEVPEQVPILLDEAYSDFVDDLLPFDPNDTGLVRLRTFSKGHGMAGIRVGYALCHAEHVAMLNKLRLHFGVNSVAQAGALASLRDVGHLAEVVRQTREAREWLVDRMREVGFESLPSQTNFLTIDMGSKDRAESVLMSLREKRVFIRKPMLPPLDGHIRVSIGPKSAMEEFMTRFTGAVS